MAVQTIPALDDIPEYPQRKDPQDRFDTLIKEAVDGGSKAVSELNTKFIPAYNSAVPVMNWIEQNKTELLAVDDNAASALASKNAAAASAATATTKAGEAATSATAAKASETAALAAQKAAEASASTATTRAEEAASSASTALASKDAAKTSETAAAASASTASTKAGEASDSATAAKDSETSALASAETAANSATVAQAAKAAAEAARDEAQDIANVGYAAEKHAGLAKVDGKTTQADAGGVITAKDVAIGGDLGDLASARGQVGDAKEMPNLDFNTLTTPGNYRITGNPTNGPSLPLNISGASIGSLIVAGTLGQHGRIFQIMISGSAVTWRTTQNSTGATWGAWQQLLSGNKVGDGIRVTNGTISVPEYEGATASTAGTSGLVPPAAAGQQESFLTGGGEYKPALTKISDSVSLADSTTAASAKAVKAAYDLANGKQAALGFTPVQQGGGANQYASKIYLGWDGGAVRVQVDGSDMGQLVTTLAGQQKAPNAAWADGAQFALRLRREGNVDTIWNWAGQGGQPGWLWGGNDGVNMYVYNPANFSVNYANGAGYANSAGSAPANGGTSSATITTPNVVTGNYTVPAGGSWAVLYNEEGNVRSGMYPGGYNVGNHIHLAIRVS